MIVYFGIIAVLLITSEVKNICETSKTQHNDNYKDFDNNQIDINSYCNNSNTVCVVKCCDKDEIFDGRGTCMEPSNVGIDYKMEQFVDVYQWNKTAGASKEGNKAINKNVTLVRNEMFSHRSTINKFFYDFNVLEDGSLKLKEDNKRTDQWVEVSPLDFCIDYHESDVYNTNPLKLVAKLAKKCIKNGDDKLLLVASGMAVSILSLTILMYRLKPRIVRMLGTVLMAYTISLMASYTLTAVQLITMRIGIIGSIGCRVISPFIYFSILSGLFWVNIFSYEAFWKIRSFRKYAIKIDQLAAPANFLRYCLYGWGIPFLMTIIAVVVDVLKLNKLLPIEIPPFDSCFTNEKRMTLYMHLPVAILAATNCVLFLMNIYNILLLQRAYYKILDIKSLMITKRRYIVYLKLVTLALMSCALELIPNVPMIITATMHVYNVFIGGTFIFMLIYEKITYNPPSESYNFQEKLKERLRNLSGRLTIRTTTDSNLFKGQASPENVEDNTMSTKIAMADELSVNNDLTSDKVAIDFKI